MCDMKKMVKLLLCSNETIIANCVISFEGEKEVQYEGKKKKLYIFNVVIITMTMV